ncbi:hypothetical protein HK100_008246, partial [Physocladia obscura]
SGSASRGLREKEMDKDRTGGSTYSDDDANGASDSDQDQMLSLLPRLLVEETEFIEDINNTNNNNSNNITSNTKNSSPYAQAFNQPALASLSLALPPGFTVRDSTPHLSSFHSRTSTYPPPNLQNNNGGQKHHHHQQLQSLLNNNISQQSVQPPPHSSLKLSYAALSCPPEPTWTPSSSDAILHLPLDSFGNPLAASSSSLRSSVDAPWNVGSRSHRDNASSHSRLNEASSQRTRFNTTDAIQLNAVRPHFSAQNISGNTNSPVITSTEQRLRKSSAATLNSGHFLDSASYFDEYNEENYFNRHSHRDRLPSFGTASSSVSSSSATIASSTHLDKAQWFEQQDGHNFMSRHQDQHKSQLQQHQKQQQQQQQQHLSSSNQLEYGQFLNQQVQQQQAQLQDMSMPKNENLEFSLYPIEENSVPRNNNSGGSRKAETFKNALPNEQYQEQQQHRSLLEPQQYHQNYLQQDVVSKHPTKISGTLFTPQLFYPPPPPTSLLPPLTTPTISPLPRSRAVSLMITPSLSADTLNQMNQSRQYQQYHPQDREQSQQQQQQRYRSVSLQIDSIPGNSLGTGAAETTRNNEPLMNSVKTAGARFFPNNIDGEQQQQQQSQQWNYKNNSTGGENFQMQLQQQQQQQQQNQKQRLLPQPQALPSLSLPQIFLDGRLQDGSLAGGGTAAELRPNVQEYLPAGQQMQQLRRQQQQQQKLQLQFHQQQLLQQKQEEEKQQQQLLKQQQQENVEQIPAIVEASTTRAQVQQMILERNLNPNFNSFN